ncbi:serine hydrolase [Longitalea luteola]|uniref:serine hydrolase n=1 Tax=Longitalea luteola TaxID=2812563 RepID=UPI001A962FF8|nr:serine hydrolase [Longitalea luteola]
MKKNILSSLLLLIACSLSAQKIDHKLQRKIQDLVKDLSGDIGVYVKNLRTGKIAQVNADSIFPTASMVKVPILIGIQDKIAKGELEYQQQLEYKDSLYYAGEDILGSFKNGEKIGLHKVLMLMLTTSDNTASLWLQSLAGTGTRINEILDSLGMKYTRVNSRTPGREANRQQYGWGQTTPREMGTLMEKIYRGEVISKQSCEKMIRLLGRNYNDEQAIAEIPPYIFVASKNGCVNASRSEILLVMAPHGPYIFSVETKNLKDQRWDNSNEAWVLTRKLSALCWNYFEPRSRWKPSL